MPNSVEHISEQLFKTIKGFGNDVVLFSDGGKKVVDPVDARRFYVPNLRMMINYDNNENTNEVVVNLSADTDIKEIRPMLSALRTIANRFLIEYTVKTFGKTIRPKDFSFMAKSKVDENLGKGLKAFKRTSDRNKDPRLLKMKLMLSGSEFIEYIANRTNDDPSFGDKAFAKMMKILGIPAEGELQRRIAQKLIASGEYKKAKRAPFSMIAYSDDEIRQMYKDTILSEGFSGWHGSARKSINELGNAKIIVRHKRSVDEEKRGARTRQIESIFIENAKGERFKFPNKNLTAAKAMAKHIKEGGAPHDEFGQHIYSVMEELEQLKKFQRYNRSNNFFESEQEISEEIAGRVTGLRSTLKQMSGPKGYAHHFESFQKANEANVTDAQINELRDAVTVQYFDERIADSLPYVAKVIEGFRSRQEKEQEIVDFARMVMQKKGDIALNRAIDMDDPEGPGARRFKYAATGVAAWVNYIAPYLKDDELANKMMQISDTVFEVGPKHVNLAQQAINVVKQNASVAETTQVSKTPVDTAQIDRINETFNKYNVRKIFGV